MHHCKFAQLEMGAALILCLPKKRLKYFTDISMFNYKPRAILFHLFACMCVFLCNDSLLNVSDDLSNVTGPCSYLSLMRTQAGD